MAPDLSGVGSMPATQGKRVTAPTPEVDGSLLEVLAGHRLHASMNICTGCGWRATPDAGSLVDQHAAHLARVVQGWADERVAGAVGEALEEAAVAVERHLQGHGLTEAAWLSFYDAMDEVKR